MIDPALQSLAVPVASLNFDPANVRKHDQRNIDVIKASLTRFGQRKPIVVQKKGMIVRAGNGTLQAVKELGWTEIAAVVLDDDDITATAYSITDNRSAELATWHEPDLARLLKELEKDIDVSTLGFNINELDILINGTLEYPNNPNEEYQGKGMPEFDQPEIKPFKDLIVRFLKKENYEAFIILIGQPKMTEATRSIEFPERIIEKTKGISYQTNGA